MSQDYTPTPPQMQEALNAYRRKKAAPHSLRDALMAGQRVTVLIGDGEIRRFTRAEIRKRRHELALCHCFDNYVAAGTRGVVTVSENYLPFGVRSNSVPRRKDCYTRAEILQAKHDLGLCRCFVNYVPAGADGDPVHVSITTSPYTPTDATRRRHQPRCFARKRRQKSE
jgi:hypothetical protein